MRLLLSCLMLLLFTLSASADGPLTLDVWPGKAPGEKGDVGEEFEQKPNKPEAKPIKRIANVTRPTLTVFRPAPEKDTGAAVMICPGGGYSILAWDLEGEEVATWLNSIGVTGIVLKYRVPARKDQPKHLAPLQDAQRALSLIRSKASEWKIDPNRLGILGFSAGGNLSAIAANPTEDRVYPTIDAIDEQNCRPNFAVLVYPAYLNVKGQLAPELKVTKQSPPTFFAHASDDGIGPDNSIVLYQALHKAGVRVEMHLFARAGHGFGLRPTERPASHWPQRCEEWMKDLGLLRAR